MVPTWAETVAEIDVRFQAEVKAADAVPLLAQSLKADPALADRTLVTSFHPEILLAVRRAFPAAATGRIFGRTPPAADVSSPSPETPTPATALCGIAGLTPRASPTSTSAGLDVTAWPVPDQQTLTQAVALGVNGITTDNPHLLQPVPIADRHAHHNLRLPEATATVRPRPRRSSRRPGGPRRFGAL